MEDLKGSTENLAKADITKQTQSGTKAITIPFEEQRILMQGQPQWLTLQIECLRRELDVEGLAISKVAEQAINERIKLQGIMEHSMNYMAEMEPPVRLLDPATLQAIDNASASQRRRSLDLYRRQNRRQHLSEHDLPLGKPAVLLACKHYLWKQQHSDIARRYFSSER